MKQERIQNPNVVDRAAIESKIAEGFRVTLQFDQPGYTPELLKKINNLCGELGKDLVVRFYGHYGRIFDASVLLHVPDVVALSVDCLMDATNLSALNSLSNLRSLSLGIYRQNDQNILKSLQIQNIETLAIGETAKVHLDLAPLEACSKLSELFLVGHCKNIDSLARLPQLQTLSLRQISKKQRLDFVSGIQSLKRLKIILGGRENISEIRLPSLEELEVVRVLGFNNIESIEAFPSLRTLVIEDQIRLERVRFTASNKGLKSIKIFNCKKLRALDGMENLTELRSIRIGMTALDVDSILGQSLAGSLKTFAFHTGKVKDNAAIRKKLNDRGYRERDERSP